MGVEMRMRQENQFSASSRAQRRSRLKEWAKPVPARSPNEEREDYLFWATSWADAQAHYHSQVERKQFKGRSVMEIAAMLNEELQGLTIRT